MKNAVFVLLFCIGNMLVAQNWQPNFDKALETANENNLPIILVFSGSDWCGPCMKLENDIWKSDTFITYASENYVLYKADFPQKRKNKLPEEIVIKNALLAERYNPNGYFPFIVILDGAANMLGAFGYEKKNAQEYIAQFNSVLR